jgi:hypothetical protein
MKTVHALLLPAVLVALCLSSTNTNAGGYRYRIYCIEGVVRVEHATLEELAEEAEGSVCLLARTTFNLSTARLAAKRFGGVGAPCRCAKTSPKKS